jgi:endo-1,4-beta-xylanase
MRSSLIAICLLTVVVVSACSDSDSGAITSLPACADPADCRLWEAGQVAGVRVGLAGEYPEGKRREIVLAEGNIHENHALSWASIWPERDRWAFEDADRRYAFIEEAGMLQAGFHFAWEQVLGDDLPDWVQQVTDPEELRALLRERAQTIFERYPDLDRINVVNEPLTTFGTTGEIEKNYFYRVLGPDYVAELFAIVDAVAPPTTELVLNENFIEYFPSKADALVRLVAELVDAGVPIDSVGFQTHLMLTEYFNREPDWELYQRTMERVAALGVDVWISELDNPVDPARKDRFAYQAENYRRAVESCLSVPNCTDILIYGVEDEERYWGPVPYDDPAPLLFDKAFAPKPAYFAVRDALLAGRP